MSEPDKTVLSLMGRSFYPVGSPLPPATHEKIAVRTIILTRRSGPPHEIGVPHVVRSYQEADALIGRMCVTAPIRDPAKMRWDVIDFQITYDDGFIYTSFMPLWRTETPALGEYFTVALRYLIGRLRPDGVTPEQYELMMSYRSDETTERDRRCLNGYDTGAP
jgi:hypothetical protein